MSRLFLTASAGALLLASCLDSPGAAAAAAPDRSLPAFQTELLDLAFGAASALPVNPHVKNRSLAQEDVVDACLELGQPRRARVFIEQIENWRRGAGYADLAFHLASRGATAEAKECLELARQIAEQPEEESGQGWRNDRIRIKIARTLLWLGEADQAAEMTAGTADSEAGEMADARARATDEAGFDARMEALDAVVATLNFDLLHNALLDCAHLYGRFYGDAARRARAEERVKASWGSLPVLVRIELMMELARQSLAHADAAKALALIGETQLILDSNAWTPEDQIQLRAQLALLRHRAGDPAKARAEADAAHGLFEVERVRIVDVYRAGALRHLAEAYQEFGDTAAAREVYRQALGEATVNPNSRPRAMDLATLCASMALRGVEPDAALWERLREVRAALGDPW